MPAKPEIFDRAAWLKGGEARCNISPVIPARPRRLVLLGAPGVGKGTQADLLASRLGLCHLATGDIFRTAKGLPECKRSPTLNSALEHMHHGELVPEDIILNLLVERTHCLHCKGGFVLDGFPRTVRQAEVLDKLLTCEDLRLDAVIHYELPLKTVVARLGGRRVCPACKAVFHETMHPPKVQGICDQCSGPLETRDDDRPECIAVRMQRYLELSAPLNDYYRMQEVFLPVSGEGSAEEIFERTVAALQKMQN